MSGVSDPIAAALLRERAAYQRHGLTDRVAQVDAELTARGVTAKSEEKLEATDPPKGRRAVKHDTA